MRNQIYKQILFLSTCLSFIININGQTEFTKDDFEKLSLNIKSSKSEYFPLEPILLQFEVSNKTDKNLNLSSNPDFKRISLEVTFEGKLKTFASPFLIGPGRAGIGGILEEGKTISKTVLLDTYLDEMFPEYGKYQVSIILNNGRSDEMKASTRSNIFEITIKKPTGINKEAVEFLRQNQDHSFFWWKEKNEAESITSTGKPLIENFANKYSESVFGEYATLQLGHYYFNGGEIERARIEFEKVKKSNNKYIAEDAKQNLFELERKRN